MSAPRFLAPAARESGQLVVLPPDESHHLQHVLRLGAGAQVIAFDGRGKEWTARVAALDRRAAATLQLEAERTPVPEPAVRITLGIGVLKGEHMDDVVRDATALGIAGILPIVSQHVAVSHRAWKSGAAWARWRRVAVAAAKQCERATVPDIAEPLTFTAVFDDLGADRTCVIGVEPSMSPDPAFSLAAPASETALLLVGPEGGWSEEELQMALSRGAVPLTLGPRRLTSELAPIVLLSTLRALWGW